MTSLFNPLILGKLQLKNRIIMAPLTRGRAGKKGIPGELMAEYYAQRASAGLIIAEATAVTPSGRGWLNSPGLYNQEQQDGWAKVSTAVHKNNGRIFVQLWHMGAAVHPDFIQDEQPVSASDVKLIGQLPTPKGRDRTFTTPRALSIDEIKQQVDNFARAARRAIDAGLDGVEIHAANGFLIDQFTRDRTNHRNDNYGGNIDNRLRFMCEVVAAVSQEIGSDKVGIRISPTNSTWGINDSAYKQTFTRAMELLNPFNLAYVHILESKPTADSGMEYLTPLLRKRYQGTLLANGGYNQNTATMALDSGLADAITFGVPFIANPDLVERYQQSIDLAKPDNTTFYSQGPEGYIDYLPM